jgi:GAF domain-containing protein
VRLLRAYTGTLTRVVGEHIVLEAFTRTDAAGDTALQARFPVPLASNSSHALALRDRAPLNIADAEADPRLSDWAHGYARVRGYRSQVVVPLLHQADAIGTISVARREAGGFETDEITLIQTFADQAVIAIENARLFGELQNKAHAVAEAHAQTTEALEQQTATAEILRVISSSPTDVQPVFDAIVASAQALSGTGTSAVFRLRDDVITVAAADGVSPAWRAQYPRAITPGTVMGRAIIERHTLHVEDLESDPTYETAPGRLIGVRTILGVPTLRAVSWRPTSWYRGSTSGRRTHWRSRDAPEWRGAVPPWDSSRRPRRGQAREFERCELWTLDPQIAHRGTHPRQMVPHGCPQIEAARACLKAGQVRPDGAVADSAHPVAGAAALVDEDRLARDHLPLGRNRSGTLRSHRRGKKHGQHDEPVVGQGSTVTSTGQSVPSHCHRSFTT